MPQVEVTIGGRAFDVACQSGEEPYLRSAAAMLDTEAAALSAQIGRMPESRMLLMAGLMLADKTAGLEDRVREAEARIAEMADLIAQLEQAPPRVLTERVEVPVEIPVEVMVEVERLVETLPGGHLARLADLADAAEAIADEIERA